MSLEEQFDMLYLQILQQGKGIEPLFQSLFSCLRRRTDFYKQPDSGFTSCENAFKIQKQKYEEDQLKEKLKKEKELQKKKEKEEKEKQQQTPKVDSILDKSSGVKEITKEEFERRKREEEEKKNNINNINTDSNPVETKTEKKSEKKEEEDDEAKKRREKCAKMDESVRQELLKKTQHLSDKNGGRTRNYTWVQHQVEQFEMYIPVDKDTKGNQIKVTYDSKHLKVVVKGEVLVDGELYAAINADSFLWTLDEVKDQKVIMISFDKIYKMNWWDYVIKGDELLTLSQINPDASKLSDLDPSMRPEIEKMMFENSMKMQNKPYHKDPKTNDLLQKFMKEHPEMDFSKAQIN